ELAHSMREEARDQTERIGSALLRIENGVSAQEMEALLEDSMRQAHNLKGTASSLGFTLTAKLAHAIESVLAQVRRLRPETAILTFDVLHRGLSAVDAALAVEPGTDSAPAVTATIELLQSFRPEPPVEPSARVASAGTSANAHAQHATIAVEDLGPAAAVVLGSVSSGEARASDVRIEMAPEPARPATAPGRSAPRPPETPDATMVGTGAPRRRPLRDVPEATARSGEESLRVSMRKLNALMAQVGELLAARLRTDQRLAELRSLLASEEENLDRHAAIRSGLIDAAPASTDPRTHGLLEVVAETAERQKGLVRKLRELVRAFETDALQSTILSGELQEDIRRIQTFPLASVLDPLPRAVRSMAREAGKEAELVVEGAELELDKKVLEALRDPLNHLLRNAVDHGLEPPTVRARAGKPARGTLWIRAKHRGDSIVISIADDGQGVDVETVIQRARERGLVAPGELEGGEVTEQRLLELLCVPGFTTKEHATGLSGRGVGLDAVRKNVEDLQGSLSIDSRRGVGTTVTIVLPLTIYVVRALVLRVGTHELAMPISSISRILRVSPDNVLDVERSEAVVIDGRPTQLVSLATLLGVTPDPRRDGDRISVVVVTSGNARCALAVDEIVGDQTVLAKSLEPPLVRLRNIAGATIRGDGSVLLMLNPLELMRSASARPSSGSAAYGRRGAALERRPRILLVDDSFTTRALERSVFELAGFDVVAVADGQEAIEALAGSERFDAVVSDVAMPRVTGFDLCTSVRADERTRTLPVVLVTSLGSDADRRRGMDAGADAYVVKSEFDHEKLVAKVNELIGRR
ncbi:MAG: hybrid sensor histidine kinase/response regulator, partial [Deltaproteobacteria bacterium]|nr:hybrid sensor histidine kinase/response regulator [Deltaproteobacteria bacterium]